MAGGEMAIVIAGTREDWPRGTRILTPHDPIREPNGRTLWFGAGLDPDGEQVWFRIDEETIGRMPEKTPTARGDRLVDALIVWITPDRQLEPVSTASRPGSPRPATCAGERWISSPRQCIRLAAVGAVRLVGLVAERLDDAERTRIPGISPKAATASRSGGRGDAAVDTLSDNRAGSLPRASGTRGRGTSLGLPISSSRPSRSAGRRVRWFGGTAA